MFVSLNNPLIIFDAYGRCGDEIILLMALNCSNKKKKEVKVKVKAVIEAVIRMKKEKCLGLWGEKKSQKQSNASSNGFQCYLLEFL